MTVKVARAYNAILCMFLWTVHPLSSQSSTDHCAVTASITVYDREPMGWAADYVIIVTSNHTNHMTRKPM